MSGLSRDSGRPLDGWPHVVQSIGDILTTPLGSRIMRRDYGSRLHALLDRPANRDLVLEATLAIAEPLRRWEPRFQLERVTIAEASPGRLRLELVGVYRADGARRTVPVTLGAAA